jgi:lysophospholipase L1-like esterase
MMGWRFEVSADPGAGYVNPGAGHRGPFSRLAARHADPNVEVFDPLAGYWHFPRIGDHLHPTDAGHRWIAERLAAGLRGHQVAA